MIIDFYTSISNNINILSDVIIPLLCSLITGLITYLGVNKTIKNSEYNMKEQKRLENKPYIYAINEKMIDSETYKNISVIMSCNYDSSKYYINGIIKNTDNGLFSIDKVMIGDNIYYRPFYFRFFDKNEKINVFFGLEKDIKLTDNVVMYIKDVLGNTYEYLVELSKKNKNYYIEGIVELDEQLKKDLHIKK